MVQPPSSTQTAYVAPKPGSAQQQLMPQPQQQAIPEDVRWIMRNSSGFWTRPHKYGPILEDERAAAGVGRKEVTAKAQMITAKPQTPVLNGNPPIRTQSQPHVHRDPNIERQKLPSDDYGKQLVQTPDRIGSSRH